MKPTLENERLREEELGAAYLRTHPLAMDICRLADKIGPMTPSEVAERLGVSIQTVSDSLREMTKQLKMFRVEKQGKRRIYTPIHIPGLKYTVTGSSTRPRQKGGIYTVEPLVQNLASVLEEKAAVPIGHSFRVNQVLAPRAMGVFDASKMASGLIFSFKSEKYAVVISYADDYDTYFSLVGRLRVIEDYRSRDSQFWRVFFIAILSKSFFEQIRSDNVLPLLRKPSISGNKLLIWEEIADGLDLLDQEFPDRLAKMILSAINVGKRS